MNKQSSEHQVNLGRHQAQCSVCKHPSLEEVAQRFAAWDSATAIAADYNLSRDALYRHARVCGWYEERARNLLGLCGKVLERVDQVEINGGVLLGFAKLFIQLRQRAEAHETAEPREAASKTVDVEEPLETSLSEVEVTVQ